MTEPNPYSDGEYTWGPGQQQGYPAYGYPNQPPGHPGQAPGYGYPGPGPEYSATLPAGVPFGGPPQPGGAPLVSIGDITVLNDTIVTPSGTLPLRGAVWSATDMSRTEENIPAHAIVLAIVFFIFCLLGLLFLLMKEKKTTGFIQVTVTSGGKHHATMIPASRPGDFMAVMGQVNYVRSLSSM